MLVRSHLLRNSALDGGGVACEIAIPDYPYVGGPPALHNIWEFAFDDEEIDLAYRTWLKFFENILATTPRAMMEAVCTFRS